ncbi:MAG: hypothetical protein GXO75_10660 [Calditrichaeota bacterium]|nr:hypothetical protein [Calditrichota bacterium]
MDKILSARVDESVVQRIGNLARQLKTTKKQIIEGAITLYAEKIEKETKQDILDQTFGAWQRNESIKETVQKARKSFRDSMLRHQE